jgi:hypothetical protein
MPVDESSSQDATLIDDDLVSALGFEPVTGGNGQQAGTVTRESVDDDTGDNTGDSDSTGDSDEASPDAAVVDSDEADGAEADGAIVVDQLEVDEIVDADGSQIDSVTTSDEPAAEVSDEPDVIDPATDDAVDLLADGSSGTSSFFDLDDDDADADVVFDTATDEADAAPVEVIDLDRLDAEPADTAAVDDATDSAFADDAFAATVFADTVSTDEVVDREAGADTDIAVGDHTGPVDHDSTETISVTEGSTLSDPFDVDAAEADPIAAPARRIGAVKRRRRLRARKSRRVIRHIDPWSVLTFSVLFHMVVFAALLLSSVLVWNAAIASGMVENVESFIQELGDYETFTINADVMFRAAIVIAGMLTLASSVMVVLLTVVFNLISDLVGGIRVTVIEEETVRVPIDKKRSKTSSD